MRRDVLTSHSLSSNLRAHEFRSLNHEPLDEQLSKNRVAGYRDIVFALESQRRWA